MPESTHVLSTPFAVIAGLTYDSLPFMVLPLFVALKGSTAARSRPPPISTRAASSAFAASSCRSPRQGSTPGSLLVAITNIGDYVSAPILGGPKTTMIGNIIQTQYLQNSNYPAASALALVLMVALLAGMFVYARAFGTRTIQEYV